MNCVPSCALTRKPQICPVATGQIWGSRVQVGGTWTVIRLSVGPKSRNRPDGVAVGQEMFEQSSGRNQMVGMPLLLRMLVWFP
jgi:hypothetical protein